MTYPLYVFFGIIPSFAWLLFYLRKDSHPESNKMILKIFIYGMLAALPTIFLEFGFFEITKNLEQDALISLLNIFVGIALIEEFMKYLVVREKVLSHPECDEPLDIMLYMVIAGLGFAALENILVLFSLGPVAALSEEIMKETLTVSLFRFLGATFLHTLSSGLLGFFLAISFGASGLKRASLFLFGLGTATALHGLYNFYIMKLESQGERALLMPIIILLCLAVFMTFSFRKLKNYKSNFRKN